MPKLTPSQRNTMTKRLAELEGHLAAAKGPAPKPKPRAYAGMGRPPHAGGLQSLGGMCQ
jgi:hypothetical protein